MSDDLVSLCSFGYACQFPQVPATIDNLARLLSTVLSVWERNDDNQDSDDSKLFGHMSDLMQRIYDWQDLSKHSVEGGYMVPGSFG